MVTRLVEYAISLGVGLLVALARLCGRGDDSSESDSGQDFELEVDLAVHFECTDEDIK